MLRDTPFLAHRVHYDLVTPSIEVEFVEKDEHENEHLKKLPVKEYFDKFPLPTKTYSLQDLLDAGVHLEPVNPAIYESKDSTDYGFNQNDVLEAAKELKELDEQSKTE
jgi:hypothetical protein